MKAIVLFLAILTIQETLAGKHYRIGRPRRTNELNRICRSTRFNISKKDETNNDLLKGLFDSVENDLGQNESLETIPKESIVQELQIELQATEYLVLQLLRNLTRILNKLVYVNKNVDAEALELLKSVTKIAYELAGDPNIITKKSIRDAIDENPDLVKLAEVLGVNDGNLENIVSQAICFLV